MEDIDAAKKQLSRMSSLDGISSLSARDIITLYGLSRVLRLAPNKSTMQRVAVHLVHLVILRYSKLAERSVSIKGAQLGPLHDNYMRHFTTAASCALWGWFQGEFASATWDAYDLFDGRVYRQVSMGFAHLTLPDPLHGAVTHLAKLLQQLSGIDIDTMLPTKSQQAGTNSRVGEKGTQQKEQLKKHSPVGLRTDPVLPFSHPVLDPFLQPVHVKTAELSKLPAASPIFQELTHWHNAKKPLDPKFIPKPPGFFARKRNQKFMADTIAYSASLTGSSGKNIEPEIIVVQPLATSKKPHGTARPSQDWKTALKEKSGAKAKTAAVSKKQPGKSGKQNALDAAEALKAGKTQEKIVAVLAFWDKLCAEFECEPSLIRRYAKAQKHLLDVSTGQATAVESEVSLYLCHVLALIRSSKGISPRSGKSTLPVPNHDALLPL
jgi:hypothetical protein